MLAQTQIGHHAGVQGRRALPGRAIFLLRIRTEKTLGIDPGVGQNACPRRQQLVRQPRGGRAGQRQQLLARLHVGNPFGGHRVTAQVGVAAAVVEPGGLLQFLKQADKALRLKAGLGHHPIAHTIGLAFHVA